MVPGGLSWCQMAPSSNHLISLWSSVTSISDGIFLLEEMRCTITVLSTVNCQCGRSDVGGKLKMYLVAPLWPLEMKKAFYGETNHCVDWSWRKTVIYWEGRNGKFHLIWMNVAHSVDGIGIGIEISGRGFAKRRKERMEGDAFGEIKAGTWTLPVSVMLATGRRGGKRTGRMFLLNLERICVNLLENLSQNLLEWWNKLDTDSSLSVGRPKSKITKTCGKKYDKMKLVMLFFCVNV